MDISFFLGANSGGGFHSLYGDFPGDGDAVVHIIKGGPGTGKSGYMRAIAEAARSRGLDAELILCSGDPASLDGLYLPALRQAWVDGTAPHVREPLAFGVDCDYVNLGIFCRLPLSRPDRERTLELNARYKALYRQAYAFLAAARQLRAARPVAALNVEEAERIRRRARAILLKAGVGSGGGRERRRFVSAYSCAGMLRLNGSFNALCKLIYIVGDSMGEAPQVLELVRDEALTLGAELISCPDPLEPEKLQALLLPESGLGFAAAGFSPAHQRRFGPASGFSKAEAAELRRLRAPAQSLERRTMALALEKLGAAKALHDELELLYRPYMDFPALDAFTEASLSRIFGG